MKICETLLLARRITEGATQRDYSTQIGVKRNAYKEWEQGIAKPTGERLKRLTHWARSRFDILSVEELLAPAYIHQGNILTADDLLPSDDQTG